MLPEASRIKSTLAPDGAVCASLHAGTMNSAPPRNAIEMTVKSRDTTAFEFITLLPRLVLKIVL
jgi:hypothetical protein